MPANEIGTLNLCGDLPGRPAMQNNRKATGNYPTRYEILPGGKAGMSSFAAE
jgi:hypothetical protein